MPLHDTLKGGGFPDTASERQTMQDMKNTKSPIVDGPRGVIDLRRTNYVPAGYEVIPKPGRRDRRNYIPGEPDTTPESTETPTLSAEPVMETEDAPSEETAQSAATPAKKASTVKRRKRRKTVARKPKPVAVDVE